MRRIRWTRTTFPRGFPRLRRTLVLGVLAAGLWVGFGMPGFPGSPPVLAVSARSPRSVPTPTCPAQGPSPSLACDKALLLALRDDLLAGSHTKYNIGFLSWRDDVPVRDFWGITVGGVPPRVTRLELSPWWRSMSPSIEVPGCQPCTYLGGIVPPALGRLAQLEHLALTANRLTGPIPDELGQLPHLQHLDLSDNYLTGPIPSELGQLPHLQHLDLSDNRLTSPIPSELGQLPHLQHLDLSDNRLTSPIPSELGQLPHLQHLDLSDNRLTSPIPSELGQLPHLQHLDLSDNRLTSRSRASWANSGC